MYRLEVDCVTKHFGRRRVLTNASLRAVAGQVIHLVGPNGAGKTTLLRIAAGLLRAEVGRVSIDGTTVPRPTLPRMARLGLFFMPEEPLLTPSMPLARQLRAVSERFGTAERAEVVGEQLALQDLGDQSPTQMSVGEQRRATLAVAVLRNPAILLADEPIRGIDPIDSERMLEAMRDMARHGAAVVVTGHEMGLLGKYCDETYKL